MFDHVGSIEYDAAVASEDSMMEAAIEAGADDVVTNEDGHEIITAMEASPEVSKALEAKFGGAAARRRSSGSRSTNMLDDGPAKDPETDLDAGGQRRRPERLRYRDFRRSRRQDGRLSGPLGFAPAILLARRYDPRSP